MYIYNLPGALSFPLPLPFTAPLPVALPFAVEGGGGDGGDGTGEPTCVHTCSDVYTELVAIDIITFVTYTVEIVLHYPCTYVRTFCHLKGAMLHVWVHHGSALLHPGEYQVWWLPLVQGIYKR